VRGGFPDSYLASNDADSLRIRQSFVIYVRSVAIFRATRNGVRPISVANNGATTIAFGGPRSSRRALRAAPGLPLMT